MHLKILQFLDPFCSSLWYSGGIQDQGTQTKEFSLLVGSFLAGQTQLLGPPPTCHRNGEGRDQVYFMSASLEKLVFLFNLSNPVCCHMGVWE